MLGEQAQILLRDVFAGDASLVHELDVAHRIARRIVRWGNDDAHVLPHSALVIAGDRLGAALPWGNDGKGTPRFALSTVAPPTSTLLRFGQREASATPVVLQPGADPHAALVEAITHGWLFLIPTGAHGGTQRGWLLVVGAQIDESLEESRLVASAIAETGGVSKRFETAPRILDAFAMSDTLALGTLTLGSSAVAFDPICGDGVATAVRGGILAAAVAAEMIADTGLDRAALTGHYRAMLIAAMRRHLAVSSLFYQRGGQGPWWREQAEALAHGHVWCTRQLAAVGDAQFVLVGDRITLRDRVV